MTRAGKCETCRKRKVKCDEQHPICGVCRRQCRPCIYKTFNHHHHHHFISENKELGGSADRPQKLINHPTTLVNYPINNNREMLESKTKKLANDLSLKKSWRARDGNGVFQTLVLRNRETQIKIRKNVEKATLAKSLSNTSSILAARWISVETHQSSSGNNAIRNLLEGFNIIPSRLGTSRPLDLAVECFLDSHLAFRKKDEDAMNVARSSSAKALKTLRIALLHHTSARMDLQLFLAVKLHAISEDLRSLGTRHYAIHTLAASEMLKRHWSAGFQSMEDSAAEKVVMSRFLDEMNETVMQGRDSAFDTQSKMCLADLHQTSTVDIVWALLVEQTGQLPRFIRSVRYCLQHPNDIATITDTLTFAEKLQSNDPWRQVEKVMATSCTQGTTKRPEIADMVPSSFHFDSIKAFNVRIAYCAYRCVLCGAIEKLLDALPSAMPRFDMMIVESLDVQVASSLAMCVEYALEYDPEFPVAALDVLIPLQLSFGSWHRLQKRLVRQNCTNSDQYLHCMRMKKWSLDTANIIQAMWDHGPTPEWRLEVLLDAHAGGELEPWMLARAKFNSKW